jgi:hypothetical protein
MRSQHAFSLLGFLFSDDAYRTVTGWPGWLGSPYAMFDETGRD